MTASFLIVHVSVPYSVKLYISALAIIFLMYLFNPPFNNSFLLINTSFPSLSFFLISLWHLHHLISGFPSSIIRRSVLFFLRRLLFSYSFLILLTCLSSLPLFSWC